MVVDDSATVRQFAAYTLRAAGHEVITAPDGQQALEKMAVAPVDLLITDLNMPRLDGYSLVEAVRADAPDEALPIVILSSLSDREAIDQGMALGADAYLTKPFDEMRLQAEVEKHLD